ncbi:MAG: DotH/IcmK family type IV secretion protein [Francisellaceae bacterium]
MHRTLAIFLVLMLAGNGYANTSAQQSAAFNSIMAEKFPLSNSQIHDYKTRLNEQQKAIAEPPGQAPAQSSSSIIPVDFKPGGVEPVIRIGEGMISSIVMTDKTGKIWPITSYSLGDKQDFDVSWNQKSAVLMIQGLKPYGQANIAIMLKGLNVPVMLSLVLGQKQWDYLDYIRVNSYQTADEQQNPVDKASSDVLISLLNGIPPKGAQSLNTTSNVAELWSYAGKYLLLTPATLISPQWQAKESSTAPTIINAYEFTSTPSFLLSVNGVIQQVNIKEGA